MLSPEGTPTTLTVAGVLCCPAPPTWVAPGAQVMRRGGPGRNPRAHLPGAAMSYAHVEAAVFLAGCCAVGCIGGLIVTGLMIWREARRDEC